MQVLEVDRSVLDIIEDCLKTSAQILVVVNHLHGSHVENGQLTIKIYGGRAFTSASVPFTIHIHLQSPFGPLAHPTHHLYPFIALPTAIPQGYCIMELSRSNGPLFRNRDLTINSRPTRYLIKPIIRIGSRMVSRDRNFVLGSKNVRCTLGIAFGCAV